MDMDRKKYSNDNLKQIDASGGGSGQNTNRKVKINITSQQTAAGAADTTDIMTAAVDAMSMDHNENENENSIHSMELNEILPPEDNHDHDSSSTSRFMNLRESFRSGTWDQLADILHKECNGNAQTSMCYAERYSRELFGTKCAGKNVLHDLGLNERLFASLPSSLDKFAYITDFIMHGSNYKLLHVKDDEDLLPLQAKLKKWTGKGEFREKILPTEIVFSLTLLSDIVDRMDSSGESSRVFECAEGVDISLDGNNNMASDRSKMYESMVMSLQSERSLFLEVGEENDKEDNTQYIQLQKYFDEMAKMENFMETFLYLEGEHRQFVFDCSAIKAMMMRPESLDEWLVKMLNSDNIDVQARAVEYLTRLSALLSGDSKRKEDDFVEKAKKLHTKLLRLHGLMLSLVSLDHHDLRDLASTPIISNAVDCLFSHELVAFFLILDLVGWMTMAFFYRKGVDGYLVGREKNELLVWISLTNVFAQYFGVRETIRGITMIDVSQKKWSIKYWIRTNSLLNALSLTMLAGSLFLMKSALGDYEKNGPSTFFRVVATITSMLLWSCFLTKLKSINIKFATFTTSIVEITKDIFWYLAILSFILVCFSQMFVTMLIPDYCMTGIDDENNVDDKLVCDPQGDWGLFDRAEDFERNKIALVVFVLFSFFIVIVMMNVVIAIIGESYNRCLEQSRHLFGRDRILLVAELAALRNMKVIAEDARDNGADNDRAHHSNSAHTTTDTIGNGVSWIKTLNPKDWIRVIYVVEWTPLGVLLAWILPFIMTVTWLAIDFIGLKKAFGDDTSMAILIFTIPLLVNLFLFYKVQVFLSNRKMSRIELCLVKLFGRVASWAMSHLLAKEGGGVVPQSSQQMKVISERLRRIEDSVGALKRKDAVFGIHRFSSNS